MEIVLFDARYYYISFVELYDEDEDSVISFYELIEKPDRTIGVYDNYHHAQREMDRRINWIGPSYL
ncbi:MAG TPA: hypothetical protein VL995_20845 [Cellvibrio sp.]|nr:hypothetical protein [Cellvibrio sp.]